MAGITPTLAGFVARRYGAQIDTADEQSRSAGYCRFERPKTPQNGHLPTARVSLADTPGLLRQIIARAQDEWHVRHDDGRVLFTGTRREADGWMERQISQWDQGRAKFTRLMYPGRTWDGLTEDEQTLVDEITWDQGWIGHRAEVLSLIRSNQ